MIDLLKDLQPIPPLTQAETVRAQWIADLALTSAGRMTTAERFNLLGHFYDVAISRGMVQGGESVGNAMLASLKGDAP